MILIVVLDGLRPDLISAENTPYLHSMSRAGVFCSRSHAVFPSATRINSASLATGCLPGRHGIVDNELYVPGLDAEKAISCADWEALQAMAELESGRLLSVPTLGEVLRQAGKVMVSGGSGSPGTTYLTNPTVTGPIVNWAVAWPEETRAEIARRFDVRLGPDARRDRVLTSTQKTRFVLRVMREYLVPEYEPDLVTLWLTEPDHAQHQDGLGSPPAMAMLREVDEQLQDFAQFLRQRQGANRFTCFLLSDHGFSTIARRVSPEAELVSAGLKSSIGSSDVVRASNSLYLNGQARERVGEIVRFLQSRSWIGAVLVRDDLLGQCPDAMPQSAVFGAHRRSAELMFAYRWSSEVNRWGFPGQVASASPIAATHGSASPYALRNTLVAWGDGIRTGVVSEVPCGIVDIAPTVLQLLGVESKTEMDGRVLLELLTGAAEPRDLRTVPSALASMAATPMGPREQMAHYSHVGDSAYLDNITMSDIGAATGS